MTIQRTISPVDGRVIVERELADEAAVARALERAEVAFPGWRAMPVAERCALLEKAVTAFVGRRDEIAHEITAQMGRPIAQSPGEVSAAHELLGLTGAEAELLPQLRSGVALWKIGARSFLVEHRLGSSETGIIDTDGRMATNPEPSPWTCCWYTRPRPVPPKNGSSNGSRTRT